MLGVNDSFAVPVTANDNQDPEAATAGSWFDVAGWQSTAQNMLTGLVAGKINKQYGLDLSSHMPYTKGPNGDLVAAGGTAAYQAYDSGALAGGLRAAGFVQQYWPVLLGGGLVVAFLLLRK